LPREAVEEVPDLHRALLLEQLLGQPLARRTSDKTVHLLPHRSLRKRPFIHPVRITVTEVGGLGKTLRLFTRPLQLGA
jgi:hypothetical protein